MKIALIGNPNCGKSTLFNLLTGSYQKIGNWSGVTTEKKEGKYIKNASITIVDLPGVYSLDAKSKDEQAVTYFLSKEKPDAIINLLDGTNLERNLFLTTQIVELGFPTVLAVNFLDTLNKSGQVLNLDNISKSFGVPSIAVSALKNGNIDKLMDLVVNGVKAPDTSIVAQIKAFEDVGQRFAYVESVMPLILRRKFKTENIISDKLDSVLLGKYTGIPLFVLIMAFVYFVSIRLGGYFGERLGDVFNNFGVGVSQYLSKRLVPQWIISLFCDAIIGGVATVMSFLPQILVLFSLLTVIEESGYAARIAFLTDRIFRSFGLGGKSFIPLMLSCGCTVTGLMATRTEEMESERTLSIFLTPFMPCGAKTAVFGWFASVFFGGSALVATSMYFLGIISVCIFGRLLRRISAFTRANCGFTIEIPPLRSPHFKDVFSALKEKVKDFLFKAGLIVFVVSVVLWALQNLGIKGYTQGRVEESFLFYIGNALKYMLYPLGVKSWEASVAVISGIFAKESVIETLELLGTDLSETFPSGFSVYAFCSFVLLSPPCIAALAQARRELGSNKLFASMLVFQFAVGYLVGILINLFGILFCNKRGLLLSLIIVIIVAVSFIYAIKSLKNKKGCKDCTACNIGDKVCRKEKRFTI